MMTLGMDRTPNLLDFHKTLEQTFATVGEGVHRYRVEVLHWPAERHSTHDLGYTSRAVLANIPILCHSVS